MVVSRRSTTKKAEAEEEQEEEPTSSVSTTKKRKDVKKKDDDADKPLTSPLMTENPLGQKKLRWQYRILARIALILGVMAVVYYNGGGKKEQSIAKHDEVIRGKFLQLDCKGNTRNKACGRMISDSLLLKEEVLGLVDLSRRSLGQENVIDLSRLSKVKNRDVYNFKPSDKNVFQSVKSRLKRLISDYFKIDYFHIFLANPCLLVKATADFPSLSAFSNHKNNYVAMIDLSQSTRDFKDGKFVFVDKDSTNRTIEAREGRITVFSNGEENLINIEKTSVKGDMVGRVSLILGFTTNEKNSVPDPKFD